MAENRKTVVGLVTSDKMQKTAAVAVQKFGKDPFYGKRIKITRKYLADNQIDAKEGDRVLIEETKPLSRHKRWRVKKVLDKVQKASE